MNSKKFIGFVFGFFVLVVGFVGGVNYVVDPGYVYLKKYTGDTPENFAKELLKSENGLIATGWNERQIKAALAKHSGKYNCVVLGSSHIMQISQIRNTGNINQQCSSLLNLGVSGAGLEDIAIFTNIILDNTNKPKNIYIDIVPWTFKFNMDTRYKENQQELTKLINKINQKKDYVNYEDYSLDLLKNLFNFEYFITSLKSIDTIFDRTSIQKPTTSFTYEDGYTEPLKLSDGSHLYDAKSILKWKDEIKTIKIGGGEYNIKGEIFEHNAINFFQSIIKLYSSNNIKVNFILTPYHENVFANGETKHVMHLKKIEEIARNFALKNDIKIYGSFNPKRIGCKKEEFLDFMHASTDCLNKIDFSK